MTEPTTIRESLEAAFNEADDPAPEVAAPSPEPEIEAAVEPASEADAAPAGTDLNTLAEKENQQPATEQGKPKKTDAPEITPGPKSGPKADKAPTVWKAPLNDTVTCSGRRNAPSEKSAGK